MILYLDTSALVKIYIEEEGTDYVLKAVRRFDIMATHLIAYVEAHAAFARLAREKVLTEEEFETTKRYLTKEWESYLRLDATQTLMMRAAELAEGLRLSDGTRNSRAAYGAACRRTARCFGDCALHGLSSPQSSKTATARRFAE